MVITLITLKNSSQIPVVYNFKNKMGTSLRIIIYLLIYLFIICLDCRSLWTGWWVMSYKRLQR